MVTKNKIKNNIELISLHIPKTAGTSFRNTLTKVYRRRRIARLDIRKEIQLNKKVFNKPELASRYTVLHGHFRYTDLITNFEIDEASKLITWLRDPADRVISNYFYLKDILKKNKKKSEQIRSRIHGSLLEYARSTPARNRMSKFLEGIEPEEMFFIGITEHYEADLKNLAEMLGWDSYRMLSQNKTSHKPQVDEETRMEIIQLNELDYEIYNKALEIREERLKQNI